MDWDDIRIILKVTVAAILLIIGAVFWAYVYETIECKERWKHSGMEYRYGFFSRCMVKTEASVWVPAERVVVPITGDR